MFSPRIKSAVAIILVVALAGFGYTHHSQIQNWLQYLNMAQRPCQQPITYSIGTFDSRFGISKTDFLNDISKGESIWETPIQKQLFTYVDKGGTLTINLVYDYRQEATAQLAKLGIVIKDDQSSYDTLKAKYQSLLSSYNQQKAAYDALLKSYQTQKAAYEAEVAYWNSHGGAPKAEFDKLSQERDSLNAEVDRLNSEQASINSLVESVNAAASVLNRLVNDLNINANTYNTIGASQGSEFEEGEYVTDASGKRINIYQFDNQDKLIRVLAHELGHALGLGHVDDPKAIMYKLNQGTNEKATPTDIAALKTLCGIK